MSRSTNTKKEKSFMNRSSPMPRIKREIKLIARFKHDLRRRVP